MFFNGKLAMFFQSTGSMANIIKQSTANSINVGVAFLPTWDKPAAPTGGGNIAMVERGNDKAHLDAAWEFVNFLMSDEQVAFNSVNSGYLPTTKTSVQTDIIKNKWEENPQFKVAFEQLSIAQEIPYSPYKSDVETAWRQVCSLLIQDRSINAEEAVQMLKDEVATILP